MRRHQDTHVARPTSKAGSTCSRCCAAGRSSTADADTSALKRLRGWVDGNAAVPLRPLCPTTNGFCPKVALPRDETFVETLLLADSAKKLCRPRVASAMLAKAMLSPPSVTAWKTGTHYKANRDFKGYQT